MPALLLTWEAAHLPGTAVSGNRLATPGILGGTTELNERPGIYEVIPATMCEGVDPMGRGRAKAKQTKVARELKYRNFETDFSELQRELHGEDDQTAQEADSSGDDEYEDPYADDPTAERHDEPESAQRH